MTQARPLKIADVLTLTAGVTQYDAMPGWTDLGGTKTGTQISINNSEETFDLDQELGDIASLPNAWEASVGTQLVEATPERLQIAWEGSAITKEVITPADAGPPAVEEEAEEEIGFGTPTAYTQRRLAVMYQRPNGKIRAYFFHKVQRLPQESSITHAKTGEQISVPVRFRVLPDNTVALDKRLFIIRDQMPKPTA
jgi:hypothetical protein